MKEISDLFPAEIDSDLIPGVFHLGYHSVKSFGATSYLIKRSEGANYMIDVPRFNSKLADNIEEEGGIGTVIITNKDNIAGRDTHLFIFLYLYLNVIVFVVNSMIVDVRKWKERFPSLMRVIHRLDATKETEDFEVKLEGLGKWNPEQDITIIHAPGYTTGSLFVISDIANGEKILFSGTI